MSRNALNLNFNKLQYEDFTSCILLLFKCEKAFQHAKDDLSSDAVLVHFDPKKSLVLSVDASPKGVV